MLPAATISLDTYITEKILEPLSILTKYKTNETQKIDNIFIYLRFDYISVIVRVYPDDDWNIVET
jgi:hypothetical protein